MAADHAHRLCMAAELPDGDVVVPSLQQRAVPPLQKCFRKRLLPVFAHGKHHLRNPFCAGVLRESLWRVGDAKHFADGRHDDAFIYDHTLNCARLDGLLCKRTRNRLRLLRFSEKPLCVTQCGLKRIQLVPERRLVDRRLWPAPLLPVEHHIASFQPLTNVVIAANIRPETAAYLIKIIVPMTAPKL
jgi:hypothetical protein